MGFLLRNWVELLELLMMAGAALLAAGRPQAGQTLFMRAEQAFRRFAERPGPAIAMAGVFPVAVRLLLLPVIPIPEPFVHDEFAHLLVADTLAHGRLANPVHPLWMHFESFHILQQPVYASMEPPAAGLVMAAGQVLFGNPWFGVLLGMGLMNCALCWMLRQWLPPGWALAGALLAGIRWGVLSYWVNSYWGGAVAAAGGALVLGACGALRSREVTNARHAIGLGLALASGLGILAASRPLEGLLASIPMLCLLVSMPARTWRQIFLPATILLALIGCGIGYYNQRITGNALLFPHALNRSQYAVNPYFAWQPQRPLPPYRHLEMERFYVGFEGASRREGQTHPVRRIVRMVASAFRFLAGPLFLVPLLAGIMGLRRTPGMIAPVLAVVAVWAGRMLTTAGYLAHYDGPILGAILLLICQGLRQIRSASAGGLFLSRAIGPVCVLITAVAMVAQAADRFHPQAPNYAWYTVSLQNRNRAAVEHELAAWPGSQLVFVRYSPQHSVHVEWVYNRADLATAPVIWARDMGPEPNAALIRTFSGRKVWEIEPDEHPMTARPYNFRP